MKTFWVLSTFIAISVAQLIDGGFNTKLDHFDHLDTRIVHFPYLINLDYYNAGGPLYFYLNDEVYSPQWIETGLMVQVARETNGALITTHSRYFGINQPTDDVSFDNLQYLTADQAVFDVAYFIQEVKRHLASPNGRVIVWGSVYGGSLAIWARQNFPFLIDAAWSSSGLFRPTVFSTEFFDHLENVIVEHGGVECSENIRIAFQQIHNLVVAGNSEELINNFNLCEPWNVTSTMDIGLLFNGLIDIIEQNVQRNHVAGITTVCNNLTSVANDPYTSFAEWIRTDQGTDCLNFDFIGLVNRLRETDWEAPGVTSGVRQLLFILCIEGGWMHTTRSDSIFANRVSQFFYYTRCTELFAGTSYQFERIFNANRGRKIKYGSDVPNTSRVIITNGRLDPYFPFGITEYNVSDSLLFNFPNYGRSVDLDEILPSDSEFLRNAKQEIFDKLLHWATGSRN